MSLGFKRLIPVSYAHVFKICNAALNIHVCCVFCVSCFVLCVVCFVLCVLCFVLCVVCFVLCVVWDIQLLVYNKHV